MTGVRFWGSVLALNAALALAVQVGAPDRPAHSDRQEYEYAGTHGLAPNCGWAIYCYRFLVPVALNQIPVDWEQRWRGHRWAAVTAAGTVIAVTTAQLAGGPAAAAVASIITQGSFGFSFTAYDPYSAEPMVFVIAALITWCWFANRWLLAFALGLVGVFVKETVALVSGAAAMAALVERRAGVWRQWVAPAAVIAIALLGFHWIMDTYFGWGITKNAAAQFSKGSWLAIWWTHNPGLVRKAFLVFVPYGFAWAYAVAGLRIAPAGLRTLAWGAALPFLALNYVQNPERALGTAFFVIVPLATVALMRVPLPVALAAAITNGLFTAKVGASIAVLPPSWILLVPAAGSAAWVFWNLRQGSGMDDRQSE